MPGDGFTRADAILLLVIRADGAIEIVSVDEDRDDPHEGERVLPCRRPGCWLMPSGAEANSNVRVGSETVTVKDPFGIPSRMSV